MKTRFPLILLLLVLASCTPSQPSSPQAERHQKSLQRAEALVARMTLTQKASLMRYESQPIEELGIPAYNWWTEALHGVARCFRNPSEWPHRSMSHCFTRCLPR